MSERVDAWQWLAIAVYRMRMEFVDDGTRQKLIEEIPSADRPQGEWIDADGNFVPLDKDGCTTASAWCSNCGEWLTGSDEYCTSGRFCPNCGARMKGADDDSI